MNRRLLLAACAIAIVHALFFIWYQRPDWTTQWSDQDGYRRLGQVLAETGKFTRFPDAPRFVPEVLRTPVYPAFVAVVFKLFGVGHVPVACAQAVLFAVLCVVTYLAARRVVSERVAAAAMLAVAVYPPFPYFGALVLTELWTTLLFTVSMVFAGRAWRAGAAPATFIALGIALGLTALSRPVFVLFPLALVAAATLLLPILSIHERPALSKWLIMLGAFAITMLPWFAYNYATLGRFTLSPAGGVGRGLWEGSWQAKWSGRVQDELTHLADDIDDRAELDRRVAAVAEREHVPAGPMLEYVHQWEDIRRIWVDPVDPYERALARVKADQEYGRVARENLRRDSTAQLVKRVARGIFILWAAEIPVRRSDINALSPIVIWTFWAIQAVLMLLALRGLVVLVRAGLVSEAVLLAMPLVYITVVHIPLLTEARQSLPAKPIVLTLAVIAVMARRRSFAGESKIHEAQHL